MPQGQTREISKETLELKVELNELKSKLLDKEREIVQLNNRALKVFQENELLKADPSIAKEKANMDFQLMQAQRFIDSRAFPKLSAEQAFVLIQAGKEMNLSPMQSLTSLYIVNGHVDFYGANMMARITEKGYSVEFPHEDEKQCQIVVTKEDEKYEETVYANDPIILNSKAYRFAAQNKLRYHAARKVRSFHLAHLFSGLPDPYNKDYAEWEEVNDTPAIEQEIKDKLIDANCGDDLDLIMSQHKKVITKSLRLTADLGEAKKRLGL